MISIFYDKLIILKYIKKYIIEKMDRFSSISSKKKQK